MDGGGAWQRGLSLAHTLGHLQWEWEDEVFPLHPPCRAVSPSPPQQPELQPPQRFPVPSQLGGQSPVFFPWIYGFLGPVLRIPSSAIPWIPLPGGAVSWHVGAAAELLSELSHFMC